MIVSPFLEFVGHFDGHREYSAEVGPSICSKTSKLVLNSDPRFRGDDQ